MSIRFVTFTFFAPSNEKMLPMTKIHRFLAQRNPFTLILINPAMGGVIGVLPGSMDRRVFFQRKNLSDDLSLLRSRRRPQFKTVTKRSSGLHRQKGRNCLK